RESQDWFRVFPGSTARRASRIMATHGEVPMMRYAAVIGLVGLLGMRQDPPRKWIEATGHRVVRLSDDPGTASLYFHQNPYTATGDKIVVPTRGGPRTSTP